MKNYILLFFLCTNLYLHASANQHMLKANRDLTEVIMHDIFSPPVASRIYAYANIAAYETIMSGSKQYNSYAGQLKGLTPHSIKLPAAAHLEVASLAAFYYTAQAFVFSEKNMDSLLTQNIGTIKGKYDLDSSIYFGKMIANHIITWAKTDGYITTRSKPRYTYYDEPGKWMPTPPEYMDAIEPYWPQLRTMAIDSASQFRPEPPQAFNLDNNGPFFFLAKEVYTIHASLNDSLIAIANHWDCNPFALHPTGHFLVSTKKITPGGHWIGITGVLLKQLNANFEQATYAFSKVSIALFDAFISCWDAKFHYNYIRPVTAITQLIDENWKSYLQTPPFPEYTSGHSVVSGAASTVLNKIFGQNTTFVDTVEQDFGLPPRKFNSFDDAANEASESRIIGGIHFREAVVNGLAQGRLIGETINERLYLINH